jgi:signal recognition particle receptor subunit beta
MPVVNPLARELVFKVVYYGPGLGGKTTSLQHIHATTRPEHRGKMVSLATPVDRTLYFDFLPIRLPMARDMTVRLQLFTVPGQVYYNATRKLVLTGADGVVFVVDSQRARADANIESLRNLEENLIEHGRALDEIPHVFSYNKRDLPGLVSIDDMERLLNPGGAPSFATVATSGEGVYETLEAITRAVLEDFEQRMPEHRGLSPSPLMLPEGGLAEALRMAEDGPIAKPARSLAESLRSQADDVGEVVARNAEDVGEVAARHLVDAHDILSLGTTAASEPPEAPIALTHAKRTTSPGGGFAQQLEVLPQSERSDLADELASPIEAMSKVVASMHASQSTSASELPTTVSHPERLTTPTAVAAPEAPQQSASPIPGSQSATGLSLSSLWSEDERETVVRIESAIAGGELRDATLLIDVLVQRNLERFATALGASASDANSLSLLLGMDGASIVEFRMTCAQARRSTHELPVERVLAAFVFATQQHLQICRTERGG